MGVPDLFDRGGIRAKRVVRIQRCAAVDVRRRAENISSAGVRRVI